MPVEIRELQITTTISDTPVPTTSAASSQAANIDNIIAQCVEQVLDILKQKGER
jgi:hypothetical protein